MFFAPSLDVIENELSVYHDLVSISVGKKDAEIIRVCDSCVGMWSCPTEEGIEEIVPEYRAENPALGYPPGVGDGGHFGGIGVDHVCSPRD